MPCDLGHWWSWIFLLVAMGYNLRVTYGRNKEGKNENEMSPRFQDGRG